MQIMEKLKNLKIGDYFKLRENGKVYVRGAFERIQKKYSYCDFNDMNNEHFASGDKMCIVDLSDDDFDR